MYQPEMMLNIAHQREAELVREAQLCGVPQPEGASRNLPQQLLILVLVCALPLVVLAVWAFAHA